MAAALSHHHAWYAVEHAGPVTVYLAHFAVALASTLPQAGLPATHFTLPPAPAAAGDLRQQIETFRSTSQHVPHSLGGLAERAVAMSQASKGSSV